MHVIATAGHVDHGKSTLVNALTGMDPDRWAEEQRRGLTIDLGYAWCDLSDGTQLAFVDVPGHQRFITNMLAGVGPVPAVLLVIAADEGWSKQTTEHVAALDALGVNHGVLAVTRSDLGDAELAIEEARDYLAGTSLEGIEAVAVSPIAGTGLDELRAALMRMLSRLSKPRSSAVRLWVDRAFTIQGAGVVVTGTLSSGTIALGDELVVSSSGLKVGVRRLESLKIQTSQVSAAARVAVNLRGVKMSEIRRGDALIRPGDWANITTMDVRLVNAEERLPRQPILYVGSAAIPVRLRLLGSDTARLTLDSSVPLHVGDRAVLRDTGRQQVVAGIVVLDVQPPSLDRRGDAARRAEELETMTGEPDVAAEIRRRGAVRRDQLVASGILDPTADPPPDAVALDGWLIDSKKWENWKGELLAAADEWARTHTLAPGLTGATAIQRLGLPSPSILEALVSEAADLTIDGGGVHRHDVVALLPAAVEASIEELLQRLSARPFDAPESPELAAAGLSERQLATVARDGRLLRVATGIYLRPDALDQAMERLTGLPQPFTLSEARNALETTRRVAMPLLELLDRHRRTTRVDSQRRQVRS